MEKHPTPRHDCPNCKRQLPEFALCAHCGQPFAPLEAGALILYCGSKCSKRAQKRREYVAARARDPKVVEGKRGVELAKVELDAMIERRRIEREGFSPGTFGAIARAKVDAKFAKSKRCRK